METRSLNRAILQELAKTRLEDARVLLENERYAGAYYVVGYAVECGLKACIAKHTKKHDFPDKKTVNESYTHNLEILIGIAKLPLQAKAKSDGAFSDNWNLVKDWSEEKRYKSVPAKDAKDLVQAIDDPDHGILQWLQEYW